MIELAADNVDDLLIELLDGAVEEDNVEAVRFLLSRGASPTARCTNEKYRVISLLERSIVKGNLEVLKALVNTGEVNINAYYYNDLYFRYSPLLAAAYAGHINIVEYLLSLGAKIDPDLNYIDKSSCLDMDGVFRTPLIAALANNKIGTFEYLVSKGASVDLSLIKLPGLDNDWKKVNNADIATILLDAGASPDGKDDVGIPLFQRAIESSEWQLVKLLIERKVDWNATNYEGESNLTYAKENIGDDELANEDERFIFSLLDKANC